MDPTKKALAVVMIGMAVAVSAGLVYLIALWRRSASAQPTVTLFAIALATATTCYVFAATFLLWALFTSGSSTAALAIYGVPIYAGIAGGLAFVIAAAILTVAQTAVAIVRGESLRLLRILGVALSLLTLVATAVATRAILAQRQALATIRDPSLDGQALLDLYADPSLRSNPLELAEFAQHQSAPPALLRAIAKRKDVARGDVVGWPAAMFGSTFGPRKASVLKSIAANTNTPVDILSELARSEYDDVVQKVARNSYTPAEVLGELALDPRSGIAIGAIHNRSTPPNALNKAAAQSISLDPSHMSGSTYLRTALASRPELSPSVLEAFAEAPSWHTRLEVARNASTPPTALARLAEDEEAGVRAMVAKHPNAPSEALRKLSRDSEQFVRLYAINALRSRE